MRKLAVLAAAMTTALGGGLASVAAAGPPATDANGNFSVLDVDVFPPRAANPLGVTIGFHLFSGNRLTGQRQPASQSVTLRFPGFHENGVFFPKCPLPTTAQQVGSARCSRASQVGRGTAEADARPGVSGFIPVNNVRVFNGSPRGGNPTLFFLGTATIGAQTVHTEIDFVARPAGGGFNLVLLPAPAGTPSGLFSLTRVDVTAGKTLVVRRGVGRLLVSLIVPPRTCPPAGWGFSVTNVFTTGASLTARDVQSCVRA